MSLSTPEAKDAVSTLRDRLKHGQNMAKILESQLDTAQQNIKLLQGQVRLANETILNLKKYFQETENTINELLMPDSQSSRKIHYENPHKENEDTSSSKNFDNRSRSPRSPESSDSKNPEDKRDNHNKSPYAQQLRQVLDVLQDEEPRKSSTHHHVEKDCNDCNDQHISRPSSSKSSYHDEHYQRKTSNESDYCKMKHKMNGHTHTDCQDQVSPKSYYRRNNEATSHHGSYGNHCMGPCCQSDSPGSYKVMEKSSHFLENEKASHYLEKSPSGSVHYIAVHSPDRDIKHSELHHGHHFNYAPYIYHMPADNPHKAMHEVVAPMSPTGRRKRTYMPLLPNEEPPHLKYTKVKRIDGSKLTAQKVLQDFTKRRFIAYNPRYDLDLLIVPPPIPASDLIKSGAKGLRATPLPEPRNKIEEDASKQNNMEETERHQMYHDSDSISPRESRDRDDVFTENGAKPIEVNDSLNNNDIAIHEENNNNMKNSKVPWVAKQSMFSSKNVDVLPMIKEEPRSKLEDQISKLRNDQVIPSKNHATFYQKTNSPYNDNNNNLDSPASHLMHGNESPSTVPLVNHRTEQYCS